jgi:hypothetical protein
MKSNQANVEIQFSTNLTLKDEIKNKIKNNLKKTKVQSG